MRNVVSIFRSSKIWAVTAILSKQFLDLMICGHKNQSSAGSISSSLAGVFIPPTVRNTRLSCWSLKQLEPRHNSGSCEQQQPGRLTVCDQPALLVVIYSSFIYWEQSGFTVGPNLFQNEIFLLKCDGATNLEFILFCVDFPERASCLINDFLEWVCTLLID